jgi:hypothetical protein
MELKNLEEASCGEELI